MDISANLTTLVHVTSYCANVCRFEHTAKRVRTNVRLLKRRRIDQFDEKIRVRDIDEPGNNIELLRDLDEDDSVKRK